MQADLSLYTHHLITMQGMLDSRRYEKPIDLVSEMALATQVPVIIVLYYLAHLTSMTPDIEASIVNVMKFYRIEKVIGVESLANYTNKEV